MVPDAFRAVADPTRRAILDALAERELAVGEICALFPVSQPAISQHLKVLREAGLVRKRVAGRNRYYQLEAAPLQALHDWLTHYEHFWNKRLDALGAVLDREAARRRRRSRSS